MFSSLSQSAKSLNLLVQQSFSSDFPLIFHNSSHKIAFKTVWLLNDLLQLCQQCLCLHIDSVEQSFLLRWVSSFCFGVPFVPNIVKKNATSLYCKPTKVRVIQTLAAFARRLQSRNVIFAKESGDNECWRKMTLDNVV